MAVPTAVPMASPPAECRQCGALISSDWSSCPQCGALLSPVLDGSGSLLGTRLDPPPISSFIYTSKAGHFSVRFPDRPDDRTVQRSIEGVAVTIYVASSTFSHIGVESERLSLDLPSVTEDSVLSLGLESFATAAGTSLDSQEPTTFQGHPACAGTYELGGITYSIVITAFSQHQVYLLHAPSGPSYDGVVSSFVAS